MNNRRKLLLGFGAGMVATPLASFAQKKTAKVYRVGVLSQGNAIGVAHLQTALNQGLRDHGYVEGQNLIVERRYGEAKVERLSDLAADLVRTPVDVIVAATDASIAAAKRATQTIPIVMVTSADPVSTGFVSSLARPGGNITGLSTMSPELSGKRLQLLKEIIPGLSKVAVLWNPDARGSLIDYMETEKAARALRLQHQSIELSRAEDLEQAFSAIKRDGAQAFISVQANPIATLNRSQIASFALKHRLPSAYGNEEFADVGGLMSYGSSGTARWRRAASYVDKILKGAKPADLPVEQPTKFELVVNMKTAKALGLTIPQTIMVRADRVIE